MGYNAGGTYFENHRSSGFDTVANDVSCVIELGRSKRQTGGRMPTTNSMEINIAEILMQSTFACRQNYKLDLMQLDNSFTDPVEPCPLHLNQAKNDPRFIVDTMFRPDSTCYIQKWEVSELKAFGLISYGQQCCYTSDG